MYGMNTAVAQNVDPGIDRLRSGQACLVCRKRKNKCDGARPACGFCYKKSLECVYDNDFHQSQVDRNYVEALEERVRRLEQDLRQSVGDARAASTTQVEQPSDASLVQGFHVHGAVSNLRTQLSESVANLRTQSDDASLEMDHDFVRVIRYSEVSIHSALADFGLAPSGTSPKNNLPSESDAVPENTFPKVKPRFISGTSTPLGGDIYILPPRALANRLVDLFFEQAHPMIPLVHEPSFRKRFAAIYEKKQHASVPFQALLNMVFAFGCDYLDLDLLQVYELSQTFHQRATELINSVCYDIATLEVVQALHLVTLHLNSNMQFNRMWTNTGLLVRTAQALGLHLDPSDWNISPVEKELRKRLWWSIYALDRFISLKHCRPPALTVESRPVPPPATVDDDQITDQGIIDSPETEYREPSSMYFFNALIQLIHISETVLMSTYKDTPWFLPTGSSVGSSNESCPGNIRLYIQIGLVAEQEVKLSAWLAGLPEHLRFHQYSDDPKLSKLQRTLQIRYVHARLMIHRQNIISVIKHDQKNTLNQTDEFLHSVMIASVRQCIQCVCELVRLVNDFSIPNILGPWWLNVQFIFTALATLFAVKSRRSIMQELDGHAVHHAIIVAMNLLQSLGNISPTLTRCREYFESLNTGRVDEKQDVETENHLTTPTNPRGTFMGVEGSSQMLDDSTFFSGFDGYGHQGGEFYIPNVDHLMADDPLSLFSDPLIGDLNFARFDPV